MRSGAMTMLALTDADREQIASELCEVVTWLARRVSTLDATIRRALALEEDSIAAIRTVASRTLHEVRWRARRGTLTEEDRRIWGLANRWYAAAEYAMRQERVQ